MAVAIPIAVAASAAMSAAAAAKSMSDAQGQAADAKAFNTAETARKTAYANEQSDQATAGAKARAALLDRNATLTRAQDYSQAGGLISQARDATLTQKGYLADTVAARLSQFGVQQKGAIDEAGAKMQAAADAGEADALTRSQKLNLGLQAIAAGAAGRGVIAGGGSVGAAAQQLGEVTRQEQTAGNSKYDNYQRQQMADRDMKSAYYALAGKQALLDARYGQTRADQAETGTETSIMNRIDARGLQSVLDASNLGVTSAQGLASDDLNRSYGIASQQANAAYATNQAQSRADSALWSGFGQIAKAGVSAAGAYADLAAPDEDPALTDAQFKNKLQAQLRGGA